MSVRLYSAQGYPLLVDAEEDDAPYRRNGAGFRPAEIREFRTDVDTSRDDVERSHGCCCASSVEAEGIVLEEEEVDEEEDGE